MVLQAHMDTSPRFSSLDVVGGLLGLGRGQDHQPLIVFELLEPALDIGGRVVDCSVFDPCDPAEHGRGHLGDKLLLGVVGGPEGSHLGQSRSIEPTGMSGGVGQFVEEGTVVLFF